MAQEERMVDRAADRERIVRGLAAIPSAMATMPSVTATSPSSLEFNTPTGWSRDDLMLAYSEPPCELKDKKDEGERIIVKLKDDIAVIIDNRDGMMLAYFDVLADIALENNMSIAFVNSHGTDFMWSTIREDFDGIVIFNYWSKRADGKDRWKELPEKDDKITILRFNNVAYELSKKQCRCVDWDKHEDQVLIKDTSKTKVQTRAVNPGEDLPVECLPAAGVVGEIDGRCIYLFSDIAHCGTSDSVAFFKAVVNKGISLLKKHGYLLNEFNQHSFSQFCNHDLKKMLERKSKDLRNIRNRKDSIERDYLKSLKKFNEAVIEIKSINKNTIKRGIEKQYAQIESLLREGTYTKFDFKGGHIVGYTNEIKIEHNEKVYDIGKFEIRLHSYDNVIHMINLTNKKGDKEDQHHPQVYKDSHPCLGNISVSVQKLLANGQYGVLFELLYHYLCSYNEASCLCKIGLWSKNKKEAKKAELAGGPMVETEAVPRIGEARERQEEDEEPTIERGPTTQRGLSVRGLEPNAAYVLRGNETLANTTANSGYLRTNTIYSSSAGDSEGDMR